MARTLDMGLRIRFMGLAVQDNLPEVVTRPQLVSFCEKHSLPFPQWLTMDKSLTVSRGMYKVPFDRFPDLTANKTPSSPVSVGIPKDSGSLSCVFSMSPPKTSSRSGSLNDRFERALKVAAASCPAQPAKSFQLFTDE